jgi:hypothetical protein
VKKFGGPKHTPIKSANQEPVKKKSFYNAMPSKQLKTQEVRRPTTSSDDDEVNTGSIDPGHTLFEPTPSKQLYRMSPTHTEPIAASSPSPIPIAYTESGGRVDGRRGYRPSMTLDEVLAAKRLAAERWASRDKQNDKSRTKDFGMGSVKTGRGDRLDAMDEVDNSHEQKNGVVSQVADAEIEERR